MSSRTAKFSSKTFIGIFFLQLQKDVAVSRAICEQAFNVYMSTRHYQTIKNHCQNKVDLES